MVLFCKSYIDLIFDENEDQEHARKFLLAELEYKRGQLRPEQYTEAKEYIENRKGPEA